MPRHHRRNVVNRFAIGVAALFCAVAVGACGSSNPKQAVATTLVANLREPIAFASNDASRLFFAERLTGQVRAVVDRKVANDAVAQVEVSTEGQRGLLGMTIDSDGRVFVAYTEKYGDRRIIVSKVQGSVEQIVWRGPVSQDLANGGHLEFTASGSLLIGIGELAAKELELSLGRPARGLSAGRLLELDPNGRADQMPKVMSSGWHNPYAFVVRSDGSVWVADNAPNGTAERLARGDRDGRPTEVTELNEELIPTAITADATNDFVMCTLTGSALRKQLGHTQFGSSITKAPCTRAAYAIPGTKRVVFSNETTIYEISIG